VEIITYNVIDTKTMEEIVSANARNERQKKRATKNAGTSSLYRYSLVGMYYYNDGSLRILTQLEYVVEVCTTDSRGVQRCTYYYHNHQIVEYLLNKEGELVTTNVIPKRQTVANTSMYNGHIALISEDNITHFIYNDTENNHDPKKTSKKGSSFYYTYVGARGKTRLSVVTQNSKGKYVKTSPTASYKQNLTIYPGEYIRVNQSTVIVWGMPRKAKEFALARFTINEKKGSKNK
jgi:hypothetical protein